MAYPKRASYPRSSSQAQVLPPSLSHLELSDMAKLAYKPAPVWAQLGALRLHAVRQAPSSFALWGIGAGTAALLLLSVTPLVKREVLVKVPVLGNYYEDKTPASDKPF